MEQEINVLLFKEKKKLVLVNHHGELEVSVELLQEKLLELLKIYNVYVKDILHFFLFKMRFLMKKK